MSTLQIQCPGCEASYPLDSRRVPPNGMPMRCPKCGASFRVGPDGAVTAADPKADLKRTALGVGNVGGRPMPPVPPRKPDAMRRTIVGAPPMPPPPPPAPGAKPPLPPGPRKPAAPSFGDLPAPAGRASAGRGDANLPAPARRKPLAPAFEPQQASDDDLPAPARRKPLAPAFEPQQAADDDLPAPARRRPLAPAFEPQQAADADLPAPAASRRQLRHTPFDVWSGSTEPDAEAPDFAAASENLGWDLDLPAASGGAGTGAAGQRFELDDLPAPSGGGLDLEFPAASGPPGGLDLDVRAASQPDQRLDLDLHAPTPGGEADLPAPSGTGGFDLDLPAPARGSLDLDLPARSRPGGLDLDLPARSRAGGLELEFSTPAEEDGPDYDLPAPQGSFEAGGFEAGGFDLDLPQPSHAIGRIDLPRPSPGAVDLPVPRGSNQRDLPTPSSAGGGFDLDLPIESGQANLPRASSEPPLPGVRMPERRAPHPAGGGVQLPQPGARPRARPQADGDLPVAARFGGDLPTASAGFDLDMEMGSGSIGGPELDLEELPMDLGSSAPAGPVFGELEDDFALPTPRERLAPPTGEVAFDDLPEEAEVAPLDLAAEPALEFEDVPEADPTGTTRARPPRPKRKKRSLVRGFVFAGLIVVLILGAGAALTLTPFGLFGQYFVEQFLPDAGEPASRKALFAEVEEQASLDSYMSAREALTRLAAARRRTGLDRTLLTRSVVVEALYQIRFGDDPHSDGRIDGILARLKERGYQAPGVELARAADALHRGDLEGAKRFLSKSQADPEGGPYSALLTGELALAEDRFDDARKAFETSREKGGGARAEWGIARASAGAGGELDAALKATLDANPNHIDARVARARIAWQARQETVATDLLLEATGWKPVGEVRLRGSRDQRSEAWTDLGRIHEARGRRVQAREAYDRAIVLNGERFEALLGSGRIAYADHRFSDALTRFKTVANAEEAKFTPLGATQPLDVAASIGIARALIALGRAQGALAAINPLAEKRPDDPVVQRVLGQTHRALGASTEALAAFDRAIELDPSSIDAYAAKAELHLDRDEAAQAGAVLEAARSNVPETAEIRRMMGEIELKQGHLDKARAEFEAALKLDPGDVASTFGIGVVQRRKGELDAAEVTFDKVSEASSTFPGLALERGRIFEERGNAEKALESYQSALAEAPGDPSLLALVGHAQLVTGALEDAKTTAEALLEQQPESPDARLLIGRVEVALGDVQEGVVHLEAALQLDPSRADIHLHLGWAMLAKRSLGRAIDEANEALKRDPDLAEAYWLRGRVRGRAGLVRDAVRDLEKAYRLAPDQSDILADMAEAYLQMDDRTAAIESYARATRASPQRGEWWSKLAFLYTERSMTERALEAATQSVASAADGDKSPWLAEAHRILGDIKRRSDRKTAAEHYRKYLEIAPPSALDRVDVERSLARLEGSR